MKENEVIDLGNGYTAQWLRWSPDRRLNPQYAQIADIDHAVLEVKCPHGRSGALHPDTIQVREVFPNGPYWNLLSLHPLHLEPSIQYMKYENGNHVPACCHGHIREGKWINA